MIKNILPKSLIKYQYMIEQYSDERYYGDGLWVYLKDAYKYEDGRTIIHESTILELKKELKNILKIKGMK